MTAEEFAGLFDGCRKSGAGYMVKCPCHGDREQSLSISDGDKGVVLHCHAGCKPDDVVNSVGLSMCDLFYEQAKATNGKHIAAEYSYTDESGKLLYQSVRFEPKDFRQRSPDGNGGWVWTTKAVHKVLYRLPEILKAKDAGETIFVAEGEKDVGALVRHGFAATCNVGGAGKWAAQYNETLAGCNVVVLADKDKPGREHAQKVAAGLEGIAKGIKVIELPGEYVKDAHDYFASGKTAEQFKAIVRAAPLFKAAPLPWLGLIEDAAEIVALVLPPVVEVVEGLITEQAKFVIGSSAKSFKTWLSIAISLCISHGKQILGRNTTRKRVLYVNLELKKRTFQYRVQTIAKALEIAVEKEWFYHLPLRGEIAGLTVCQMVERIIAVAKDRQAEVCVIDPQYKMNVEGEENNSRDQTLLLNQIDRITTEARCTVILNDHFSKGNQSEKDPLDTLRGSSAKGGDIDGAMILRRHDEPDCFSVDVVHRELPPVEPFVIGWEFPLMKVRDNLDPAKMKTAGRAKQHDEIKLLRVIEHTSKENPIAVSEWATLAKVNRSTLYGYVESLRQRKLIDTIGEGNNARKYITDAGRKALL